MAALKFPAWMQPLVRGRKAAPTDDPAAFGAELGLEMSLSPQPAPPLRTLPRSDEELEAQRLRRARREDDAH